ARSSLKSWAEVLIGLALLFMGLQALKESIPDLDWSFVSSIPMDAWWALPLFVGIGTLLTILVQSSSAAMALTIVLCNQGLIPFEMAAGIIMGENIGTTVTANLAALIANVHAKRAARAHFIFNVFGVIWMMFAYNLFLNTIDYYITSAGDASPFTEPTSVPIALSIFHATFNLTNSLLLIWFVRPIEKLVIRMVPSKGEEDEKYHLEYIGSMTATSELALMEASKELAKLGHLTRRMLAFTNELVVSKPGKKANLTFERIEKYEEITDRMEVEVADYLMKLSEGEISNRSSLRVRSMLSIVGDLERIGDIFYQMSKTLQRKMKEKIWFTPEQRNSLRDMLSILDRAFEVMLNNLDQNYEKANMEEAMALEKEINALRDRMRHEQLKSIENKNYNIHSGIIYTDLYSSCEKIGDHLIAVTQAVTGEV
ncbi:MAG: Na/Pi symporter, partial [Bacteroidota bacterium]